MKNKFLSVKAVTTMLGKSDREIYKAALLNDAARVDFLRVVGEIVESSSEPSILSLIDMMVFQLYQPIKIRKTIEAKIDFAEKNFLSE